MQIALEALPATLRTTEEAVNGLVERGEVPLHRMDDAQWTELRQLQNAQLMGLMPLEQWASTRGVTIEQAESLIRLGLVNATQPFAPEDPEWRVNPHNQAPINAEMLERVEEEIPRYHAGVAAAAQAKEDAVTAHAGATLDRLANLLDVSTETLVAQLRDGLNISQEG